MYGVFVIGARRRGSRTNSRFQKGIAVVSAGCRVVGVEWRGWVKGVEAWIMQLATMLKVQRNCVLSEG